MQLIIMHACVKTSDIKQPFELLPSVFATSSQYKEYFNQFYSYRYPFDDIYLLFYQPMYDYITANCIKILIWMINRSNNTNIIISLSIFIISICNDLDIHIIIS